MLTLMTYSMQLFSELQNTIKFSSTFKSHTRYMCFATMATPEVAAQNGRPQVTQTIKDSPQSEASS